MRWSPYLLISINMLYLRHAGGFPRPYYKYKECNTAPDMKIAKRLHSGAQRKAINKHLVDPICGALFVIFYATCSFLQGCRVSLSQHGVRDRVHLHWSRGWLRQTIIHTESSINLIPSAFLRIWWKKPEHPETQGEHEKTLGGIAPGTFSPWGNSTNQHTTVPTNLILVWLNELPIKALITNGIY